MVVLSVHMINKITHFIHKSSRFCASPATQRAVRRGCVQWGHTDTDLKRPLDLKGPLERDSTQGPGPVACSEGSCRTAASPPATRTASGLKRGRMERKRDDDSYVVIIWKVEPPLVYTFSSVWLPSLPPGQFQLYRTLPHLGTYTNLRFSSLEDIVYSVALVESHPWSPSSLPRRTQGSPSGIRRSLRPWWPRYRCGYTRPQWWRTRVRRAQLYAADLPSPGNNGWTRPSASWLLLLLLFATCSIGSQCSTVWRTADSPCCT